MKQPPLIGSQILSFASSLAMALSLAWGGVNIAQVQAQSPTTERESAEVMVSQPSAEDSIARDAKQLSLERVLTRFARRATEQLRPDVRNGLIRVMVATAQGKSLDQATRQALAASLAHKIAQQPNILILEPDHERAVMARFSETGLEFTENRSISIGQHTGVRYVLMLTVSNSESPTGIKLKTKTVSVKRRGSIKASESEAVVSMEEIKRFQKATVFYEKRLDATWRSALIPGWGQLYQGRTGAAVAYMSLTAGLLIGGFAATQAGDEAATQYQKNTVDKVYYRQLANNHYARAQMMWGALGVTWISSTLSAYLQGEDKPRLQLNFDPEQSSFKLSGVF